MSADNLANGATLTLSSGTSLAVSKITTGKWNRERVQRKLLSSDGPASYRPGTIYDHAPIQVEFYWDSLADPIIPVDAADSSRHLFPAVETVTITWPQGNGEDAEATLAGTGFITEIDWPEFDHDTYQMGVLTISWDGATGPLYTKATEPA